MSVRLTPWVRALGVLVLIAALVLAYWSPLSQTCTVPTGPMHEVGIFETCYADHARQAFILMVGLIAGVPLLMAPWARTE